MTSQPRDLYTVLGVARDATQDEISHAFRTLLRRHHPDTRGDVSPDTSDSALRELVEAYGVLRDPVRRAAYDRRHLPATSPVSHPEPDVSVAVRAHRTAEPPFVAGPVRWEPPLADARGRAGTRATRAPATGVHVSRPPGTPARSIRVNPGSRIPSIPAMEIRPAQQSDQPDIEAAVAAAFEEKADGRVVQMVRALDESAATMVSLVADDNAIVGHVQLSTARIDARERLVDALMLTPLSVLPERQRQGIGTRLVREALTVAERMGVAAVFLEGDPQFYGRCGFVPGSSLALLRPSLRIPDPAFQVATLSSYEPWMTGQVVFPDAMWRTDAVGLRDPRLAKVEDALRP
jgi:putative acetyltransferase